VRTSSRLCALGSCLGRPLAREEGLRLLNGTSPYLRGFLGLTSKLANHSRNPSAE